MPATRKLTSRPINTQEVVDASEYGVYPGCIAEADTGDEEWVVIRYDHDGSTCDAKWRELSEFVGVK